MHDDSTNDNSYCVLCRNNLPIFVALEHKEKHILMIGSGCFLEILPE